MKIDVIMLTPEKARQLLKRNTHNRNLSKGHVLRLAVAMERGEWKLNGDAIRISADGVLLDGQHRLMGVIASAELPPPMS